ncbi:hypothetical protein C0995_004908 [Termitomyces sp. Mi166|nr:hypothetical protein C0995_004908 [Termitomyces sp. Mi166\
MTRFTQSENALIDKLENIAGITNENVLSDTEILQGRAILAKARDNLYDHSSSQSQLSLADHISRLSIALAPHKSLPPEILERIFRFDPHSLTSLRDLSYATEILPEVAYLGLYVGPRVPIRELAPYLHFLDRLDLKLSPSAEQATLEAFPLESLSRLKSLIISMELPETEEISHNMSYPTLFGESSCLQHLSITSDDPRFLLSSDIPWSQLLSLCIRHLFSDSIHPSWLLLGRRDPFQQLTCLKGLVLYLSTAIFRVVLYYGFPWHRLEELFLYLPELDEAEDIILMMETLRKCISLTHFLFSSSIKLPSDLINHPQDPIALPSLETLELESNVPLCMIKSIVSSGSLRSLVLGQASLQDFYIIIRQCPRLTELVSHLAKSAVVSAEGDTVILPHLTTFVFSHHASLSFPTLVVAPRLTSLTLCAKGGSLPIDLTVALLLQSNMQLDEFKCMFADRTAQYPSADSLRELLNLINSCSVVAIYTAVLPEGILNEIASGSLFPKARTLNFAASSPELILATIRHRLEQERESGYVRLREIIGHAPRETFDASGEHLKTNVKDLEMEFGVDFKVYPQYMK